MIKPQTILPLSYICLTLVFGIDYGSLQKVNSSMNCDSGQDPRSPFSPPERPGRTSRQVADKTEIHGHEEWGREEVSPGQ